MLAGRFPDLSHGDAHVKGSTTFNVVLNAKAVRELGIASPEAAIGQSLKGPDDHQLLQVIGVVDDLRFRNPKDGLPPEYFYFVDPPARSPVAGVRYAGVSATEMRQRLAAAWRQAAPEVPLEIISAVDNLDKYYQPDRNRSHLFEIGALVAASIGCIGLYGMAAFSTSRRMLEVAVRKVLGASRGAVVTLLVGQFMMPVLLANLLAWPIGYLALANWLSQFSDRITIDFLPFVVATGVALAVAVITVAALAFGSANAAPAKALRSE